MGNALWGDIGSRKAQCASQAAHEWLTLQLVLHMLYIHTYVHACTYVRMLQGILLHSVSYETKEGSWICLPSTK